MKVLRQMVIRSLLFLSVSLWSFGVSGIGLDEQREAFLHAEHLLAANKTDEFLGSLKK